MQGGLSKAHARSLHSFKKKQQLSFSQATTNQSIKAANFCLTYYIKQIFFLNIINFHQYSEGQTDDLAAPNCEQSRSNIKESLFCLTYN